MGNSESSPTQVQSTGLPIQTYLRHPNISNSKKFNCLENLQTEQAPFPIFKKIKNTAFHKTVLASKNLMLDRGHFLEQENKVVSIEKKKINDQNLEEQKNIKGNNEDTCIDSTILEASVRIPRRRPSFQMITIDPKKFIVMKQVNIDEDFQILKQIGRGSFGTVSKAIQRKSKQQRAIKMIDKSKLDDQEQMALFKEFQILKRLDHPNIIKLYDIYQDKKYLYVVTQLCEGGNLLQLVNHHPLSEPTVRIIMTQLLSAVTYIHNLNILHRDIKLQNVVLVEKSSGKVAKSLQIKLIDFGISVDFTKTGHVFDKEDMHGTLLYMSPESLSGNVTFGWDVWSCGVACYMLATRKPPYCYKNEDELMDRISNADIVRKNLQQLSKELKLFIMNLLTKSQRKRITSGNALKDLWLRKQSQSSDLSQSKKMKTVECLTNFHAKNNLVSMIQSYIVCKKINQVERQHLAAIFQSIDLDKSGIIQVRELRKFYQQNSQHFNEQDFQQLVSAMDKNKSGKIDFNEFITAMCSRRKLFQIESLEEAFDFFDKNKSGELSRSQIRDILIGVKTQQVEYLFKKLDNNQDGQISKKEFIEYFHHQLDELDK